MTRDDVWPMVRTVPDLVRSMPSYIRAMPEVVFGLPLVLMDVTREVMTAAATSGEYSAPINQFHRIRTFVDPDFKNVVRISLNSLWATAFVDLEEQPFIFSHPDTTGHYMVAQVMDMWTDNFASVGTRTTGTAAGDHLIVGPNWQGTPPSNVTQTFRCPTRYAWILVQIAASSEDDYPAVHALQDGLQLTPLSAWGSPYNPPTEVPVDSSVDTTASPFDQVRLMDGPAFFQRLACALQDNPPYPADGPMVKKLEKLGVRVGGDFDADQVDAITGRGMTQALKKVWSTLERAPYSMKTVNGWILPTDLGAYGVDYNTRAFVAFVGLGALCVEDAAYPSAFVDGAGRPLDGARRYVLHFEKDGLPPSKSGTWSISPYRENFYAHNPIERYAIRGSMPLTYNADGSLDIHIQRDSPGADKEPNWLPCPRSGPFNLTVRVYQPEPTMFDGRLEGAIVVEAGTYALPPVQRLD